jgi:hypothetical protein
LVSNKSRPGATTELPPYGKITKDTKTEFFTEGNEVNEGLRLKILQVAKKSAINARGNRVNAGSKELSYPNFVSTVFTFVAFVTFCKILCLCDLSVL